jgi:hypothetical protein
MLLERSTLQGITWNVLMRAGKKACSLDKGACLHALFQLFIEFLCSRLEAFCRLASSLPKLW